MVAGSGKWKQKGFVAVIFSHFPPNVMPRNLIDVMDHLLHLVPPGDASRDCLQRVRGDLAQSHACTAPEGRPFLWARARDALLKLYSHPHPLAATLSRAVETWGLDAAPAKDVAGDPAEKTDDLC